jgi:hypothetical protein
MDYLVIKLHSQFLRFSFAMLQKLEARVDGSIFIMSRFSHTKQFGKGI